jgi:hypothetical protein
LVHTLPAADVPGGFKELYDLSKDPDELHNLAADAACAEMKKQLQREMERLRREITPGQGGEQSP